MRKRTILMLAAIAFAALVATGCDALLGEIPLTDNQRAAAFIDDANADPRDPLDLQRHFHPDAIEYSSMNQESYWNDLTFFSSVDQTFNVSGLTNNGSPVSGYPETTSLVGTITSGSEITGVPITFGFLPDPESPNNRLIRVIIVETYDTIQSVR